MPELPDITVYVEALRQRILGARLESTRITHPFLLRTFEPPLTALLGRRVVDLRRVGKRVAVGFEGGCQTGGRILADRSLSRLLEDDWPRTLDELG